MSESEYLTRPENLTQLNQEATRLFHIAQRIPRSDPAYELAWTQYDKAQTRFWKYLIEERNA